MTWNFRFEDLNIVLNKSTYCYASFEFKIRIVVYGGRDRRLRVSVSKSDFDQLQAKTCICDFENSEEFGNCAFTRSSMAHVPLDALYKVD